MAFLAEEAPSCVQEPLDAIYFYIYGCDVQSSTVLGLASAVPGFLYSSDKSMTMAAPTHNDSILLANSWNMVLSYNDTALCESDNAAFLSSGGSECVVSESCGNSTKSSSLSSSVVDSGASIEIGCGSLTCTGCVVEHFFSAFAFNKATFDLEQGAPGTRNHLGGTWNKSTRVEASRGA